MTIVRRGLPLWLAAGLLIMAFSRVFAQDGASTPMTFEDQVALFDYDASADFAITEKGSEQRGDVTVKDIEFSAIPGAEPVAADRRAAASGKQAVLVGLGDPRVHHDGDSVDRLEEIERHAPCHRGLGKQHQQCEQTQALHISGSRRRRGCEADATAISV